MAFLMVPAIVKKQLDFGVKSVLKKRSRTPSQKRLAFWKTHSLSLSHRTNGHRRRLRVGSNVLPWSGASLDLQHPQVSAAHLVDHLPASCTSGLRSAALCKFGLKQVVILHKQML